MVEKKEKRPEESLNYFMKVLKLKGLFREEPDSFEVREMLVELEGKTKEEKEELRKKYAKWAPHAISQRIKFHEKWANRNLAENVTYEWLIKNKPIEEIIGYLTFLPELEDKDKYKEIVETAEFLQAAERCTSVEEKEACVESYYRKKIGEAMSEFEKEMLYSELYAAMASHEYLNHAHLGVLLAIKYELTEKLKKAGAKQVREVKKK